MSQPLSTPSGYRSAAYALALADVGQPLALGATGGFVLERRIPGTQKRDLMAPYPLFACADWDELEAALEQLGRDHVSITLVTDPFCPIPAERLAEIFPVCRPLHDHFVIDLAAPLHLSRHHRRKLRQAADLCLASGPAEVSMAADWIRLYEVLVTRKNIRDMRGFGAGSLRKQLLVPGAHLLTAWEGAEAVGADLYFLDGEVAYAHLSAYSERGYELSASYVMMDRAIEYFRGLGARYIDLGGAPAAGASGLLDFKSGWTRLTRPSYLCGKVLDPIAYQDLCPSGAASSAYFPSYRQGEFKS